MYDITEITGKNRSGKSNILFAIINIILGTNLSGDEKACLINKKCDASYGELHFQDGQGYNHILIRGKHRIDNNKNFISLDGKIVTQTELTQFYKDKKLFLAILNPLYFLNKKPSEQREMIDKYLSNINPKEIFDKLSEQERKIILQRYFRILVEDIYYKLNNDELKNIYYTYNIDKITKRSFEELSSIELKNSLSRIVLRDIKYYDILTYKEQEKFIKFNIFNIFMDIAYDKLKAEEQKILKGIPKDIPTYISELNGNIKKSEQAISSLSGKIEYAQNIVNEKLPVYTKFEKDVELSLAKQELAFLTDNQDIISKERQKQIVDRIEKDILNKETEILESEKAIKDGEKKYLKIKNGTICKCPTCEQYIQDKSKEKTIENIQVNLTVNYNRKNLLNTQLNDLKSKLMIERCKYHALEGETTIEKSKRISIVKEKIKKLETEKLEIEKFNNQIKMKETNIKNAKANIERYNIENIFQQNLIDNSKKAKQVAQKLYMVYIEEKMKFAKQYLKDVNIEFYSVLKGTGELKEDFIIKYKDIPLQDLSRSETIATAIEFANMFNKIAKTNFPIFIDDTETCVDYDFVNEYSNGSQLIVSMVQRGTPLKIANYNNDSEFTIIKQPIRGFRTIDKYNINAVPKAA